MKFDTDLLRIDAKAETDRIVEALRYHVRKVFRRYGGTVGISGGIDSSVVLALCVKAFGPDNVLAIMMPEKESDPDSENLARQLAVKYQVEPILENITPILEGFNCYPRRDEAIRRIFPEYDPKAGYTSKIGLPQDLYEETAYNIFYLTIISPDGEEKTMRLPPREYLQIVAASNFKQRTRMSLLYYHAELHNFAVIGTGNKNEHEQGFFVKYGDGGADIMPIAHLFKTQVYQLAEYLEVPDEIRCRPPTTDTYSARSTQQEFFFRLPFELMDLLWYAKENKCPISEVANAVGLSEIQVQRAFDDFTRKQRTTEYLRSAPINLNYSAVE